MLVILPAFCDASRQRYPAAGRLGSVAIRNTSGRRDRRFDDLRPATVPNLTTYETNQLLPNTGTFGDYPGSGIEKALNSAVAGFNGPDAGLGELMRYIVELAWAPDAILQNSSLAWREIDKWTVEVAAMSDGGVARVALSFDENGDIFLFGIRVRFGQPGSRLQLSRGLFKCEGHHVAGPAPRSPEIHNSRDMVAADMFLDIAVRKIQRMRRKQRFVPITAFRFNCHACRRYAIDGVAVWINDILRFTHELVCSNN